MWSQMFEGVADVMSAAEVIASFNCTGDRYVVVDCGGGTVDLTVHQIRLPGGHLKELYKASGQDLKHSFPTYFSKMFQQM